MCNQKGQKDMVGWELMIESLEWDLTSKLGIFGDHKTAVSLVIIIGTVPVFDNKGTRAARAHKIVIS